MAHYYLARYAGAGSGADPFRPNTDVEGWRAVDLRPDPTVAAGRCLLMLPERNDPPQSIYLGDDPDAPLGSGRTLLANALGVNLETDGLRRVAAELLIQHAREDGTRWRPLRASGRRWVTPTDGQGNPTGPPVQVGGGGPLVIFLGPDDAPVLWQMPTISGGADFAENFNTTDSDTLGPLLSWTEVAGDWDVVSNRASLATLNTVAAARADRMLFSDDHVVECRCYVTAPSDSTRSYVGPVARFDPSADTGYAVVLGRTSSANEYALLKVVSGSVTVLAGWSSSGWSDSWWAALAVSGSSLIGSLDVSPRSDLWVTDTSIEGNARAGLRGFISSGGAANDVDADDFRAYDVPNDYGVARVVAGPRVTLTESDAASTTVMLPDAPREKGQVVVVAGSIDGTVTPTWPAGWDGIDNSSLGGAHRSESKYHFIDGTEGWDGVDDSIVITHNATEEAAFHAHVLDGIDLELVKRRNIGAIRRGINGGGTSSGIDPPHFAGWYGYREWLLQVLGYMDTGDLSNFTGIGGVDVLSTFSVSGGADGVSVLTAWRAPERHNVFDPTAGPFSGGPVAVTTSTIGWPSLPRVVVRETQMPTPASSMNVLLPDYSHLMVGSLLLLIVSRDGSGSVPSTLTGWTSEAGYYAGLSGTVANARVFSRIIDGTEGWDGVDDAVSVSLGATEDAVAFAVRIDSWYGNLSGVNVGNLNTSDSTANPHTPASSPPWGMASDTLLLWHYFGDPANVTGFPSGTTDGWWGRSGDLSHGLAFERRAYSTYDPGQWTVDAAIGEGGIPIEVRGLWTPPTLGTVTLSGARWGR